MQPANALQRFEQEISEGCVVLSPRNRKRLREAPPDRRKALLAEIHQIRSQLGGWTDSAERTYSWIEALRERLNAGISGRPEDFPTAISAARLLSRIVDAWVFRPLQTTATGLPKDRLPLRALKDLEVFQSRLLRLENVSSGSSDSIDSLADRRRHAFSVIRSSITHAVQVLADQRHVLIPVGPLPDDLLALRDLSLLRAATVSILGPTVSPDLEPQIVLFARKYLLCGPEVMASYLNTIAIDRAKESGDAPLVWEDPLWAVARRVLYQLAGMVQEGRPSVKALEKPADVRQLIQLPRAIQRGKPFLLENFDYGDFFGGFEIFQKGYTPLQTTMLFELLDEAVTIGDWSLLPFGAGQEVAFHYVPVYLVETGVVTPAALPHRLPIFPPHDVMRNGIKSLSRDDRRALLSQWSGVAVGHLLGEKTAERVSAALADLTGIEG